VLSIPSKFRITNSIFPKLNALTIALSFVAAPLWTLDESWVLISTAFVAPYFAILYGLKKLTANWPSLNVWIGVPILFAFSLVPVLPAYTAAVLFYPDLKAAVLYGLTISFTSMTVFVSLALLDSLDYGSRNYRLALEEQNRELAVEMTLFEQQLWAARRNWSLVIHGTVQASLTAALTRLNAPDADKKTLELAKKDLDRAIAALTNPPSAQLKFAAAIKDLADTWQGVCDIEIAIPADLKKVIAKDARLSMCVNEIFKEAISNAVRHGNARSANIAVRTLDGKLIEIEIINDGLPPSAAGRKGLGSALLDELAVDWQLSVVENRDQTVLLAHLPFSSPQA
jgi:signal transduction histidine kinase